MKPSRVWLGEFRRVALFVVTVTVGFWLFALPWVGLGLSLTIILAQWFYQLWRIQGWLSHPETSPPEGYGIWGDIFDRIYHLRRKEKEAREELQSAVEYLRDSFASMRDATVMVDSKGAIQWSNEAAEQLLGLRYPEDRGQGVLNLVRIPEFHRYFRKANYSQPLQINTRLISFID